jgi:hypothetical protein
VGFVGKEMREVTFKDLQQFCDPEFVHDHLLQLFGAAAHKVHVRLAQVGVGTPSPGAVLLLQWLLVRRVGLANARSLAGAGARGSSIAHQILHLVEQSVRLWGHGEQSANGISLKGNVVKSYPNQLALPITSS